MLTKRESKAIKVKRSELSREVSKLYRRNETLRSKIQVLTLEHAERAEELFQLHKEIDRLNAILHGIDREPLLSVQEKLERIMKDIP